MKPVTFLGRDRLAKWGMALVLLVATPSGLLMAQEFSDRNTSPATGTAQVVAQGLAEMPTGDLVWRLVEREALPRAEAESGERVTGWVFAREESIILTDVDDNDPVDVARLAPGEAYLVQAGTDQIRASDSDSATTYLSFELVPAEQAQSTGNGTLIWTTAAFSPPDGLRDLDLVANSLPAGTESEIPFLGGQIAIVAVDGVIEVTTADGTSTILSAGQAEVFDSGVSISNDGSQSGGGVNAFAPHFQAGEGEAIYFAAVIGQEVIPTSELDEVEPTATATSTPSSEVPPTAAPVEPTPVDPTPVPPTVDEPTRVTEEPSPTPTVPGRQDLESDNDQDRLTLRDENRFGTNPELWDTDGDGLSDGQEVRLGTKPLSTDSDGDGYSDYTEVVAETDPLDPESFPRR